MGNRIDTELFLKLYADENRARLIEDIAPNFDTIAMNVRVLAKKRKARRRLFLALKMSAAILVVGFLFNAMIFFYDYSPTKAYQYNLKRLVYSLFSLDQAELANSQNENANPDIDEMQKKVPYRIPVPGWIPEGYKYSSIRMQDDLVDIIIVTLNYKRDDQMISIIMDNSTHSSMIDFKATTVSSLTFKEVKVDGVTYAIGTSDMDGVYNMCMFINKSGLFIQITGPIDEQSLIKVAASLR